MALGSSTHLLLPSRSLLPQHLNGVLGLHPRPVAPGEKGLPLVDLGVAQAEPELPLRHAEVQPTLELDPEGLSEDLVITPLPVARKMSLPHHDHIEGHALGDRNEVLPPEPEIQRKGGLNGVNGGHG